MSTSKSKGQS